MSPNAKTALFMIGATIFNILMMGILVIVFLVIISFALGGNANPTVFQVLLFVAFIGAIVITFVTYGWLMKKISVRFKLEEKMPQLFKGRKK